jgi:RHS repeat-associated protein
MRTAVRCVTILLLSRIGLSTSRETASPGVARTPAAPWLRRAPAFTSLVAVALGLCLWSLIAVLVPVGASADTSVAPPPVVSVASLGESLVGPGVEALVGGGRLAAAQARRETPAAVAQRAASRTRFEGLDRGGVLSLAEKTFGIEHPTWVTPDSDGEGHITRYFGEHAAAEVSPSGRHMTLASTVALRSAVGSGQLAPTSFSLEERGGAYVPANPLVPVTIAKTPAGGVSLPFGVSVAPVDAGAPEPAVTAGDRVVYPETAADTDFMVEPVPSGVETSWQLRSERSSPENALRFTLPAGASLQLSKKVPGGVEIVKEGQALDAIPPAHAIQADGTPLPVSYSVDGDTLTTHVSLEGSVAFPVMVDPLVVGYFGGYESVDVWTGWHSYLSCGCFGAEAWGDLLITWANPGNPAGNYGQWYIDAPGAGEPGGAGIERVDLRGLGHYTGTNESAIEAEIGGADGEYPSSWTFNGEVGNEGFGAFVSESSYADRPMAFCAQEGGGHDGGSPGLCNETKSGTDFWFADVLGPEAQAYYSNAEISGAVVHFLDTTAPNEVHLYARGAEGHWVKGGEASGEIYAHDQGVGIGAFDITIPPGHENELGEVVWADPVSCPTAGFDGCPQSAYSKTIEWPALETGKWKIGVYAIDEAENVAEQEPAPELNVDRTPPKITLSGPLAEHNGGEVSEGDYTLNVAAEDGSTSAPQSGVQWLEILVDGRVVKDIGSECSEPIGVPAPGCFDLSGSWTIEGQQFGVGTHTIEVVALDWAGNRATSTIQVTVRAAATEPVGPGAVNLKSGNYSLSASDVDIAAAGASLAVGRVYNSREPWEGEDGALGPEWSVSLPDGPAGGVWRSLRALPSGSAQVALAGGAQVTFTKSGSTFTSPTGFQTDTLTEVSASPLEYSITDASGAVTTFTRLTAEKEEAPLLVPTTMVQSDGLNKMTDVFTYTKEKVAEPVEELAPYPATLKCYAELERGCRALKFRYATATTATGEAESQWGEYQGCLAEIKLVAWNGKEMAETPVAKYTDDAQGRLRAEWDPQVSPALKTIYGYDSEDHVTSVTAPGQETWAFTYGTSAGETNTGRLLKAEQGPPASSLWSGESAADSERPVLSGSPDVGVRMAVSQGKWTGSPVAYGYDWEDCNTSGAECSPILGADNPNYTPVSSDVGHTLVAQVKATNGAGSVTVATTASAVVGSAKGTEAAQVSPAPGSTVEYGVPLTVTGRQSMSKEEVAKWGQGPDVPVEGTAIFPPNEPQSWPAGNYNQATIYYLDSSAHTVDVANPSGGITVAEYESHGDTKRTLTADDLATALKAGTKSAEVAKPLYTELKYNTEGTELEETLGPEHKVKLPSGSEVEARKQVKYLYNEEGAPAGGPYRLATTTTEDALTAGKEEDKRTVTNSYSGQESLGWKLHEPTSTTTASGTLNLVHSTLYSPTTGAETETAMPGAAAKEPGGLGYLRHFGTEGETIYAPSGEAIDAHGNLWVADAAWGRLAEYSSTGTFIKAYGSWGAGSDQFETPRGVAINASTKNIYVGDEDSSRVVELNEKGEFVRAFGFGVSNGESKLQTCTTSCKTGIAGSAAGQFSEPQGIAIDSSGNLWITDYGDNRVEEYTEKGEFIAAFGFGVANGESKLQTCTTTCKSGLAGSSPGEFYGPNFIAISGGYVYVTDYGNNRVERFNTAKEYVSEFGSKGHGNGEFITPSGITAGPGGNLYIADYGNNRVQELTQGGGYVAQFGSEGSGEDELKGAEAVAISSSEDMYVTDKLNKRVDEWSPSLTGNSGSYTSQTVYYTPKTEATVAVCQNRPEWANLPCESQPAHQPEVAGMPALPVTTITYNMYLEPEVTKSTSGEGSEAATRTETDSYDGAGRLVGKETTSSTGTSLPKVTYGYSTTTGLPVKESTGSGSGEQKITEEYNNASQLTSYTDAQGKTATYEYEKEKDLRPIKIADEKGNQTFGYNETTGELTSLKDSSGASFTASYDAEGNITSETMLPSGLTATTARNPVGEPTSLEYNKETHCSENCKWFYDDVSPSIHGQWVTQTSTLAKDAYAYNGAGWLTQVQETPTGGKCATRLYGYNSDGDRTTLTKRAPTAEGTCAKEGGEVQEHHYDTADRLLDAGTTYNPFGDTTSLAGSDAGGSELKSSFYVDGQLAGQEQAGESNSYTLDPARRTNETSSIFHTTSTFADQYDGSGTTPAWLAYTTGEWTRNIFGISGTLNATENDTETPVLQISNLHGDIIGTVQDSETATKLASAIETTEYGVPTVAEAPPHSWLGASAVRTELPSGVLDIGARSYVPQLGRFLQPDPRPGGSANAYGYTHNDPLNESDPSGELSLHSTSGGLSAVGTGEGVELQNGEGIGTDAIMPAPPDQQAEEAFAANPPWDQITAGNEEYEEFEWYEEEGEYEYASYSRGGENGKEEAHTEPAVLYQPLGEASRWESGDGGVMPQSGAAQLCSGSVAEPCRHNVSGGICDACYPREKHHHGGGGHGRPQPKKECPPGYHKIPIVEVCIKFEWPSGPSPAPSYPPLPPEPVPVP